MAEKKLDRRVQRTRHLLRAALMALIEEKDYDDITVQAILDRANVGRSTFYLHYSGGKEDLLLDVFADFQQVLETSVMELFQNNGENLSLALFQYAESHHRFYKATAGKQSGMMINVYIQAYLTSYIQDHLYPHLSQESPPLFPLAVVVQHLVGSFMAVLTWWLDNNRPYPAAEMDRIYKQLTQPGMAAILEPPPLESMAK